MKYDHWLCNGNKQILYLKFTLSVRMFNVLVVPRYKKRWSTAVRLAFHIPSIFCICEGYYAIRSFICKH